MMKKTLTTWSIYWRVHSFQRNKTPSLDGWKIEFFIGFYDLIDNDILSEVKESSDGSIPIVFNDMLLVVITKKDSPTSFDDFRPIWLWNTIYKIIENLIVVRLRDVLLESIYREKLGFLRGGKINYSIWCKPPLLSSKLCYLLVLDLQTPWTKWALRAFNRPWRIYTHTHVPFMSPASSNYLQLHSLAFGITDSWVLVSR